MAGVDSSRRNRQPRLLTSAERDRLEEFIDNISYSARYEVENPTYSKALSSLCRYSDDQYEYRHVQLPKPMLKVIPKDYFDPANNTLKLLWEEEWRGLGITQVKNKVQQQG